MLRLQIPLLDKEEDVKSHVRILWNHHSYKNLQTIVGDQYTLTDRESLAVYGYDSTPELESRPGVGAAAGEQPTRSPGSCASATGQE